MVLQLQCGRSVLHQLRSPWLQYTGWQRWLLGLPSCVVQQTVPFVQKLQRCSQKKVVTRRAVEKFVELVCDKRCHDQRVEHVSRDAAHFVEQLVDQQQLVWCVDELGPRSVQSHVQPPLGVRVRLKPQQELVAQRGPARRRQQREAGSAPPVQRRHLAACWPPQPVDVCQWLVDPLVEVHAAERCRPRAWALKLVAPVLDPRRVPWLQVRRRSAGPVAELLELQACDEQREVVTELQLAERQAERLPCLARPELRVRCWARQEPHLDVAHRSQPVWTPQVALAELR